MNDFSHIDVNNEKVKKILKSSFEVFALNDLEKASTNMIVKKAGISRGILYHYFRDKQELFDFLIYYSIQKSVNEIEDQLDWDQDDIIKRICETTKIKIKMMTEYPYLLEFSEKYKYLIYKFMDEEELKKWKERFYNKSIDYSKFKDQANITEVIHIIRWTYKAICIELLKNQVSLEEVIYVSEIIEECDKYYRVLVTNFYK